MGKKGIDIVTTRAEVAPSASVGSKAPRRRTGRRNAVESKICQHVAGCAGSGKTTLLVCQAEKLARQGFNGNHVVIVSFSTAGAQVLTQALEGAAVVLVADAVKSAEMTERLAAAAHGSLHLLLHDVHRASEGQLAGLIVRLNPASLFSVGASHFEYPQVLLQAGWKLKERILTHSFRVPPGHMPMVNALAKNIGYVLVESTDGTIDRLPDLYSVADADDLSDAVVRHVQELLRKGVSRKDLCVICDSALQARHIAKHLNGDGVPATAQRDLELMTDLRRVLWLAHSVMAAGSPFKPAFATEQSRRLEAAIGRIAWDALQTKLRRVRGKTLESIFKECYKAYLQVQGGVNAHKNRELRNFFSSWEATCIGVGSARELLKIVRAINSPVICVTPHAARGRAWKNVVVAGVEDGVWKSRIGVSSTEPSASMVELMHLTVTRAARSVAIFSERGADPTHFLSRFTREYRSHQ